MLISDLARMLYALMKNLWRCSNGLTTSLMLIVEKSGVTAKACVNYKNNVENTTCVSGSSGADDSLQMFSRVLVHLSRLVNEKCSVSSGDSSDNFTVMSKENGFYFITGAIWGASTMCAIFVACYTMYLFTKARWDREQLRLSNYKEGSLLLPRSHLCGSKEEKVRCSSNIYYSDCG
ncbi:hypothetical protein K6025_05220 [Ehrlichia sp. JZT12]